MFAVLLSSKAYNILFAMKHLNLKLKTFNLILQEFIIFEIIILKKFKFH